MLQFPDMISIISAVAENGIIGRNNDLPWQIPADLSYFAKTTKGRPVIMGLTTFKSILSRTGKPLPGRKNIVLVFEKDSTFITFISLIIFIICSSNIMRWYIFCQHCSRYHQSKTFIRNDRDLLLWICAYAFWDIKNSTLECRTFNEKYACKKS